MKANDLMLGDWVKCDSDFEQVDYLEGGNINGHPENWYEPIALTAEILEKNGFDCNHDAKTSIDLVYHDCARITEYGEEALEDGKMIRYVHELQHALRLCGIDKEMVL